MLESISCCLIDVEVIYVVFSSLEMSSDVWIDRFKRIIFLSFISSIQFVVAFNSSLKSYIASENLSF